MLNLFETRVFASMALVCSVAGLAVSASAMSADNNPVDNPDGDVVIEQRDWVSSIHFDVRSQLGFAPGPTKGWANGSRGAPDANFVLTGSLPEGDSASAVAYTPDGSKFVIAHRESRNLIIWDAATLAFIGEVPLSGAAQAMAITPDGTQAVVANVDNNTVSIVDLVTMTETAVIAVGTNPGIVAISPAGDVAAIGIGFDGEMQIIDIASASIVRTITNIGYSLILSGSFEAPALSMKYSKFYFLDDDRVINADQFADEMQIVNVRTGVVDRTPVPDSPRGLAISGDGTRAAIAHTGATRLVTLIDSASGLVIGTVPTPENLFWGQITLNTDGTKGVVDVINASRVVDFTAGTVGPSISTASINDYLTTFDGRYAVGVGYRGVVIDMVTGSLVGQGNFAVSTDIGALSPTAYQAAMCSTTFGDDLVVMSTHGASTSLVSFGRTGPEVEGDRCRTLAVSPDGSRIVGVSIFSDNASVVDSVSGAVIGTAPLGQRPSAVAITPDGTKAVVGNLDSSFATIVDLATATSTNVNISTRAGSVAISPDGQYAYIGVVASGDGVWRIDLDTNTVAGPKIATGNMGGVGYSFNQTSGIAISNDGARLAVAGTYDNVVSIIDTASWSLLANVPAGDFPTMVSFSDDDSKLYVSNRNINKVRVFDNAGAVPVLAQIISVGASPWQTVDDGQGRLWVNNWGDKRISAYDIATGGFMGSVLFDNSPVGLSYDAASDTVRVAHGLLGLSIGGEAGYTETQSGTITIFDATTFARTDYDLGVAPSAFATSSDGNVLAVAAPVGDGLAILNLSPGCSSADLAEPFGVLNFFDVSAFLGAFSTQDPSADFTDDGVFDFFDVSAFLSAFAAGCP